MAKKNKQILARDPKKDILFKELAQQLAEQGVNVRKEKLKQGLGWRVMSGQCTVNSSNFLFVDSRLSQDEQLDLLRSRLSHPTKQVSNESAASTGL